MHSSFYDGFEKTAFIGKLLTGLFVGMEAKGVADKVKMFGNRHAASMKSPSFYSYRRLPKMGNY
jgi:hypothetical protein